MRKMYFLPFFIIVMFLLFFKRERVDQKIDKQSLPECLGIIVDGNRRWAKKNSVDTAKGHYQGAKNVEEVVKEAFNLGIKEVVVFAFSTENWKRSTNEINDLFNLLRGFIKDKTDELLKNRVKVKVLGRVEELPNDLVDSIKELERKTIFGERKLNICLNYGGRAEIVDATNRIIKSKVESVDEHSFKEYLYSSDMKDPDLVIRTGGNSRISNFLLWEIAYSELFISKKLWPDFNKEDLKEALIQYKNSIRTFGGNIK